MIDVNSSILNLGLSHSPANRGAQIFIFETEEHSPAWNVFALPGLQEEMHRCYGWSDVGLGAALYQLVNEDFEDAVSNRRYSFFAAQALSASERNYLASKKEMLAVVFALKRLHYFLWGRHFTLYTDHRAPTILFSRKDLSPLLANWVYVILSYNFDIIHRPGIMNILPDTLSRFFTSDPVICLVHSSALAKDETELLPVLAESERANAIEHSHLQGHFGVKTTLYHLHSSGKYWPSMGSDVSDALKNVVPASASLFFGNASIPQHPSRLRSPWTTSQSIRRFHFPHRRRE